MPIYSYRATSYEGGVREGYVEAPNIKAAIESVRQMGLIPIKITEPVARRDRPLRLRRKKTDLLTFTTELTALLGAGLPLDRTLQIISEISEHAETRQMASELLRAIKQGSSFSDAIAKHPDVFPRVYISMVRAGETGGVLENVLEKLLEFLESTKHLRESLFSALIYPAILTLTGGISIIILLTYVIPKFSVVFEELGQSMPLPTEILIAISRFVHDYWWLFVMVFFGLWLLLKRYIATPQGRRWWDELKLKLLRDVVIKLETARFSRTLGALLKGGVPLLQALYNVKEVVGNTVISSSLDRVIAAVREGDPLAAAIERTGLFPPLAVSMIRVGEETGRVDDMLIKVADTYEKQLNTALKRFISIVEPILILTMGLVVGFIVISILIAIFSINEIPF